MEAQRWTTGRVLSSCLTLHFADYRAPRLSRPLEVIGRLATVLEPALRGSHAESCCRAFWDTVRSDARRDRRMWRAPRSAGSELGDHAGRSLNSDGTDRMSRPLACR